MIDTEDTTRTSRAQWYQNIYRGRNYDDLGEWTVEKDSGSKYIPLRRRKPGVQRRLAKQICDTINDFLMGEQTFPKLADQNGDENLDGLLEAVTDEGGLKAAVKAAHLYSVIQGSAAISFSFARGMLRFKVWGREHAHPVFDSSGTLAGLVIRYFGKDETDGKSRWFRMTLDSEREVWEQADSSSGPWTARSSVLHGSGFVPAVWFRNGPAGQSAGAVDGDSILDGVAEMAVEHDYSRSRQQRCLTYSADPQLIFQDDNPADLEKRLRAGSGASWVLSKDGKAYYLEIDGKGIELQSSFADQMRKDALELARVVIISPEEIKSGELSGYAIQLAFQPMIQLADGMKLTWDGAIRELAGKVLVAAKVLLSQGNRIRLPDVELGLASVALPPVESGEETIAHPWTDRTKWKLSAFPGDSVSLSTVWGDYLMPSPAEKATAVGTVVSAYGAGLLSQKTGVELAGGIIGVADTDGEYELVQSDEGLAAGID